MRWDAHSAGPYSGMSTEDRRLEPIRTTTRWVQGWSCGRVEWTWRLKECRLANARSSEGRVWRSEPFGKLVRFDGSSRSWSGHSAPSLRTQDTTPRRINRTAHRLALGAAACATHVWDRSMIRAPAGMAWPPAPFTR